MRAPNKPAGKATSLADAGAQQSPAPRERQLRKWVGGQLRQSGCRVPNKVWGRLRDEGYITDVLHGSETKGQLLKQARAHLRDYRADLHLKKQRSRRRADRAVPSSEEITGSIELSDCLTKQEIKRARVLDREMLRVAEKLTWRGPEPWAVDDRPVIERFRDRVLGGQVTTETLASKLLRSIGAAMFEIEFFEAHGIPVLEHESELTSGFDWGASDSWHGLTRASEVTFKWGGRSLIAPLGDRAPSVRDSNAPISPIWRGQEPTFVVSSNSVLGWLDSVVIQLTYVCPWDRVAAANFTLTGKPPTVMPIDIRRIDRSVGPKHSLMRCELTVHPWVSRGSLLRFYKRLQSVVVGPRNRSPRIKSLEFFDFVSQVMHENKRYSEAMEAWLRAHPRDQARFQSGDASSAHKFGTQFRAIAYQVLRPFGRSDSKEVEL